MSAFAFGSNSGAVTGKGSALLMSLAECEQSMGYLMVYARGYLSSMALGSQRSYVFLHHLWLFVIGTGATL